MPFGALVQILNYFIMVLIFKQVQLCTLLPAAVVFFHLPSKELIYFFKSFINCFFQHLTMVSDSMGAAILPSMDCCAFVGHYGYTQRMVPDRASDDFAADKLSLILFQLSFSWVDFLSGLHLFSFNTFLSILDGLFTHFFCLESVGPFTWLIYLRLFSNGPISFRMNQFYIISFPMRGSSLQLQVESDDLL